MVIPRYSVFPVTSLGGLTVFFDKEAMQLVPDIESYLQTQPFTEKTTVSFLKAPPGLFAKLNTISDAKNKKREIGSSNAIDAFKKEGYRLAPLQFFLGIVLLQKEQLRVLFANGIQTIELIDEEASLVYRTQPRSLCIRYIQNLPYVSLSEYVQQGVLNASRRISPRTVLFPCVKDFAEVPSSQNALLHIKETEWERHIRLTNAIIG